MNENTDNKEKLSIVNCQLSIEQFLKKDEEKDLLRFLTAGSVDDGKSTLIGRSVWAMRANISIMPSCSTD